MNQPLTGTSAERRAGARASWRRRRVPGAVTALALAALVAAGLPAAAAADPAVGATTCNGLTATHVGGPGNDYIQGTPGSDVVVDAGGTNYIQTGGGDDHLCLGGGNDEVDTGDGNDFIDAGDGRNRIKTGNGDDTVVSGTGDDEIDTGNGADTVVDAGGRNAVTTGDGSDEATTGAGNDSIDGGNGIDRCFAGAGTNRLKSCELTTPPPGAYDTSDNMRFFSFSERQSMGNLSNANSDLAFQGRRVYQGTFPGFRIIDISDPTKPRQLVNYTDCRHPSGQGDVVIYGDILVRSWDSASSNGMPAGGWPCGDTVVQAGQEGLHVIDVGNPAQPDVDAFIDLPCGSHTATGVPDPENDRLIIYSSPSSGICDGIDIVVIPLDDPSQAFYDHFDPSADLIPCADTGVILGDVLRAACAGGQGFAVWSLDPAEGGSKLDPKLLYTKNLKVELGLNINTGSAASFSNDGSTLIFGQETGGGTQARCQPTGTVLNDATYPVQTDDMKSVFFFATETGVLEGKWTLPRDQTAMENCALHAFHVVASEVRDILVLGSYQAGVGVVDFSDRQNSLELAYADPEPLNPNALSIGGTWAAYYYNGLIWESDITRGLLSWEIPGDAIGQTIRLNRLNPQTQVFTTD